MKKFLSPSEIAKICGVTTGSVIRWIREGKLTSAQTAGGHYRLEVQDVVKLLETLRMPIPAELKDGVPSGIQTVNSQTKVLIVDDELGLRQLIRSILEEHFPHLQVSEAGDGFAAGWKAHGLHPHLVILDLRLPGVDGFKVCQLIRSFPDSKHTRVIAMTGYAGDDAEQKIRDLFTYLLEPMGLEVTRAENGREAVEKAAQKAYDLILMDVHMPEMTGMEALKKMKEIRPQQKVVIFSSGSDSTYQFENQALSGGAMECLFKPVELQEMERIFRQAFGS